MEPAAKAAAAKAVPAAGLNQASGLLRGGAAPMGWAWMFGTDPA